MYKELIEYPCPNDSHLTNIDECSDCNKSMQCDVYSTMLDENFDSQ